MSKIEKVRKLLIVTSYIDNELRKLKYYIPNDLCVIVFKYYNAKKPIYIGKRFNRYNFKISIIGDPGTGKSSIVLRYAVCMCN